MEPFLSVDGDVLCQEVRVRDVDVLAEITLDETEIWRRRAVGAIKLRDLDLLNLLLTLPLGKPHYVAGLSSYETDLLAGVPGIELTIDRRGQPYATRTVRPPLRVDRVTVPGRSWRQALAAAARFGPYCERRILLDREPADDDLMWLEAKFLGIGVAVASQTTGQASTVRDLLGPVPFKPERYTGASWKFAEVVYSQTGLAGSVVSRRG
ncbi:MULTISPECIES: hypothetical protein [unclassified Aeromicrobium]|uniref:hypothetical protein n=1 Tax=unclassified Aeromicrobium TaxID=2633570 RepID=UPI002579D13F|nr:MULTISPECIES: hypothetical protein [unclassified Aeromicrobium]